MRGRGSIAVLRTGTVFLGLALIAAGPPPKIAAETIEQRSDCITHEGADLPAADAGGSRSTPRAPVNDACSQTVLDGKSCDDRQGAEAVACMTREIAIWDGVLDRLVQASADRRARQASLKTAIAAFRAYRDKACATYRAIAVNTPPAETIGSCRLTETTRFAQTLYMWFYSP